MSNSLGRTDIGKFSHYKFKVPRLTTEFSLLLNRRGASDVIWSKSAYEFKMKSCLKVLRIVSLEAIWTLEKEKHNNKCELSTICASVRLADITNYM